VVALALLSSASVGRGDPALLGTAEVAAGGGNDTNMLLTVAPDAAPAVGGWFGRVAPRLSGTLATLPLRVTLAYALDYRGGQAGRLLGHRGELSLRPGLWSWLQVSMTGSAGAFTASADEADRFTFLGGELAVRLELAPSWRLAGAYGFEARHYPARSDGNLVHLAEARLAHRSELWGVDLARASALSDGTTTLLRAGPAGDLVLGRLALAAWAWGGVLLVPGRSKVVQTGAGAAVVCRLTANLDLTATADWTASPGSSDPLAAAYDRRYLGLGLVAHTAARLPLARRVARDELTPLVQGQRVRLRLRTGARQVVVVGSWDDWKTPGQPLLAVDGDLWQVWVPLPPGTHRYVFLVDGRVVRPPDAPRYVPDEFGGEDGVLEIGP
jgi:hypothetical protein